MDINNLISGILDHLNPYLIKGGQLILEGTTKKLWDKIKQLFSKKKEDKILEEYAANPNDKKLEDKIKQILIDVLNEDISLSKGLKKLLDESKEDNFIINQKGNGNIAIGGKISNAKINIKK